MSLLDTTQKLVERKIGELCKNLSNPKKTVDGYSVCIEKKCRVKPEHCEKTEGNRRKVIATILERLIIVEVKQTKS